MQAPKDDRATRTGDAVVPHGPPLTENGRLEASAPLGRSVGHGAATLMGASLVMRALNFLGQIVLGAMLLDQDFGLFAIANSVAAFVLVLQDGGMSTLVVQRGEKAYEEIEGSAFWLGLAFNLAAGGILAALAVPVARLYGEPALIPMLLIIAASIPLHAFAAVPKARLRMQMRFGALSAIEVMHAVVRYGGMIIGAVAGLGPVAFVAPLPLIAILESIAAYVVTRRTPWMSAPVRDRWRPLLDASFWLIASGFAGSTLYMGSHMALGLTASTALVGIYYFGYSFVQQSGHLIITTAERVLLPVFSRLHAERERQRSAVVRTLRAVSVLGFSACAALGALFAPLEHLIWKGKWGAAVGVVQIMAITYPFFILHVIARSVVTGKGHFRAQAYSVVAAGVTLMLVAVAAGRLTTDPTMVAWMMGLAMTIVSFAYLRWGLHDLELRLLDVLLLIGPIAGCGVAALLTGILSDRLAYNAVVAAGYDPLAEPLQMRLLANGARLLAVVASVTAVLVFTMRVFVAGGLRECFDVLPGWLSQPARRILRV
jgi:O-antigen/teichoic acid export membrane protein